MGTVIYDDMDIDKINLNALRSAITLIPQQPELLRGTLRENLDPFNMYDDAALNDALKSAGLWDLQKRVTGSGDIRKKFYYLTKTWESYGLDMRL